MKKWELSLLVAVIMTVFCCVALPELMPRWWTAAFAPLCDGVLTAGTDCGGVVLRSKIWELLTKAAA